MVEISFVIPAYNVEKYIERCLTSIYNQDFDESLYEVIVVNDGSTDGTLRVLTDLQNKYQNLEVVTQMNQGPGAARNRGIEESQGRYIWFIDADDYIPDGATEYLLNHLNEGQLDILFFGATVIDENGEKHVASSAQKLAGTLMDGKKALHSGFDIGSVCLALWKREFLKRIQLTFLPDVFRGEDSLFCFSAVLQARTMMIVDHCCYIYEKRNNTLTTKVTAESIRRQRIGDVSIANHLGQLAIKFQDLDPELSLLATLHQRKIQMGLLYSLMRNKRQWRRWGINTEVVTMMKRKGLYPLQAPYGSWKQFLLGKVLNVEWLIS